MVSLLLVWSVALTAAGAPASDTPDFQARLSDALETVETLIEDSDRESALDLLSPLLREARAADDRRAESRILITRGRLQIGRGRPLEAEPDLVSAVALSEALSDSTLLCEGLYQLGYAHRRLGRFEKSRNAFERLIRVATASRDSTHIARGLLGTTSPLINAGSLDTALVRLETALELFQRFRLEKDELNATHLLGLVNANRGENEKAKKWWEQTLSRSRELGSPMMEAGSLSNLATLEALTGIPSHAAEYL